MFGLRSKETPIVHDKSVAATKITQVSETECKIEMIFDPIPIKRKQTKHQTTDGFPIPIGAHQIAAETSARTADAQARFFTGSCRCMV
ncbi:hypothetical protein ScalyP_jg10124 [Parmales sp. scaly parma]|nr:hypothetical protein ScalyP_jg10124 [Parmales sp. scaly parma]